MSARGPLPDDDVALLGAEEVWGMAVIAVCRFAVFISKKLQVPYTANDAAKAFFEGYSAGKEEAKRTKNGRGRRKSHTREQETARDDLV